MIVCTLTTPPQASTTRPWIVVAALVARSWWVIERTSEGKRSSTAAARRRKRGWSGEGDDRFEGAVTFGDERGDFVGLLIGHVRTLLRGCLAEVHAVGHVGGVRARRR